MDIPYRPLYNADAPSLSDASLYRSLSPADFRLLRLEGFTAEGVLKCSFQLTPLSDTGEYSAISYTWNETEHIWYREHDPSPRPIWVNGTLVQVSDKVANILCLALQANRRLVWIDSVSIDQSNMIEKGEQVAQMGEIYSRARDVLCFIGRPSLDSDYFLDQVNAAVNSATIDYTAAAIKGFQQLIRNDYWRRAWTLQEMVLANEVVVCWGSKTVLLRHIINFKKKLDASAEKGAGLLDFWGAFQEQLSVRWDYIRGSGIDYSDAWMSRQVDTDARALEIMRRCRASNACTDPRDLIYSRRALSSNIATLVPHTDYTVGVEQVYATFATNYIMSTQCLEIITLATNTSRDLPSWVPDWTSTNREWSCSSELYANPAMDQFKKEIMAMHWHTYDLPKVTHEKDLLVQGKFLCYIDEVIGGLKLNTLMWTLIRRTRHGDGYVQSELPRKDDVVFLLKGCPNPVCLRLSGSYHILVGRTASFQSELVRGLQVRKGYLWRAQAAREIVVRIK